MAGNYPDIPSWRMPYDRDGTQFFKNLVQQSATAIRNSNSETSNTEVVSSNESGMYVFPEPRDLDAFAVGWRSSTGGPSFTVRVSTNTTNGVDGTWTTIATNPQNVGSSQVSARTNIISTTALGIKAIRFDMNQYNRYDWVHLYGEPVPGVNPHRLVLWDPVLNQRVAPAHFDWGDSPRGSSADKTFRVKNLSDSRTAQSIRVAMEALTDSAPSLPGQHAVSADGTTFLAQVNIGDLAPGAVSGLLTLRRSLATNAALSLWQMRVFAEANSWTT